MKLGPKPKLQQPSGLSTSEGFGFRVLGFRGLGFRSLGFKSLGFFKRRLLVLRPKD